MERKSNSMRNLIRWPFWHHTLLVIHFLSPDTTVCTITIRIVLKNMCNFAIFIFPNGIYPEPLELFFFLKIYYLYMCRCSACMLCVPCACTAHRIQKRAQGLGLEMAVSGHAVLGIKPQTSGRAARCS